MADDPRIRTIRDVLAWVRCDDHPYQDALAALASLAADLAAAEARATEAERELVEARAENERLRAVYEDAREKELREHGPGCRCRRAVALAAAQEPPAEPVIGTKPGIYKPPAEGGDR